MTDTIKHYSVVYAKPGCQRAMLARVINRERLITVCSAFLDISRGHERNAHDAMCYHERNCRPLLFGKRHKLGRKIAHDIAIERYAVRHPGAVED